MKLKQRFVFVKAIVESFYSYYLCRINSIENKSRKYVLFNIESRISERHYAFLLYCFNQIGVKVVIVFNYHFFGNATSYAKYLSSLSNLELRFTFPDPENCLLLITDKLDDRNNLKYRRRIFIKIDFIDLINKKLRSNLMPFSMIPRIYYTDNYDLSDAVKYKMNRKFRVFFSGNVNPEVYNNRVINELFGKLTRVQIIEFLKNVLRSDEIEPFRSLEQLNIGNYTNKFVFSDWSRKSTTEKVIKGRITNSNWLNTLSETDFFLACPGFIQPMCHNVIEGLSVGSIPILEYAEMFNPPLKHGIDALVFSGLEDLKTKVRLALNMQPEEIYKLRVNVLKYYDNYLAPSAVARNLLCNKNDIATYYLIESGYLSK